MYRCQNRPSAILPPFFWFLAVHPPSHAPLEGGGLYKPWSGRRKPARFGACARILLILSCSRATTPNMAPSRFYDCRDRRVAPCWAVCAQEGANERLRAKPSSSARVLWAHLLRRASGEASHPVRSCWRSSGSACHARWASSRMRSRHRHAPFLCSLLVSSGHLEWAGRGSLVGLQL